ncbi:MAG TPA: FAD-binding oxidoreductase [Roseiflexaceae bacterium]|nr:FAD-binding oxidoreductase [Roseiflexaceae bacterium]
MTTHRRPTLATALGALLPAERLHSDPPSCAAYAVQGIVPGCVAAPASLEELSAVMRMAAELRASVTPWGGGTQQQIGGPPARLDLVLRTDLLDRVLIHEPDDLTISVEAGMALGALRRHLAGFGQMLPLDPPLAEKATIGGLIATAADGPRRTAYGTLRDLLIGITVVEAGGRVSRAGGMVVKNVSGFDMMKLYHGSFGTLALIAAANFKLLPLPRAAATLRCAFATAEAAYACLEELLAGPLTPTAVELLNRAALEQIGLEGTWGLLLRSEGSPPAVERHLREGAALASHHGAAVARLDGADDAALWSCVADLPQTADLAEGEAVLKLSALPGDLPALLGELERQAARHAASAAISARAASGVVYARLRPLDTPALRSLAAGLPDLLWVATRLPDTPRWGASPAGATTMARIKAEFDPHSVLNPGRFVV